jgi:hypothetical protein
MAGKYRCIHLIVTGNPGEPKATECGVYSDRYDGMSILMIDDEGCFAPGDYRCRKDSSAETREIIKKGIGRGCSLTVEPLARNRKAKS